MCPLISLPEACDRWDCWPVLKRQGMTGAGRPADATAITKFFVYENLLSRRAEAESAELAEAHTFTASGAQTRID
jgi:hypothetical protein